MAQGYWWDQQIRNLILVPGNEWISALSKLESITISIVLLFHINSLSSKHQAAIISDSATNLYCPSYIPQGFIVATAGEGGLFQFQRLPVHISADLCPESVRSSHQYPCTALACVWPPADLYKHQDINLRICGVWDPCEHFQSRRVNDISQHFSKYSTTLGLYTNDLPLLKAYVYDSAL